MTNIKLVETENQKIKQRLINRKEVEDRTSLKASSIYGKMRDGTFPKCIKLSDRRVAWIESEVQAWIDQCISSNEVQS